MRNSFSALSIHRLLLRFGLAAGNSFLWVFVYAYFSQGMNSTAALLQTIYLYALAQLTTILIAPLSAKLLVLGARRGMSRGVLSAAAAYIVLGAYVFWAGRPAGEYLVVFALLFGAFRALYRIPYAVERSQVIPNERHYLRELIVALAPALAGWYLMYQGFENISILLFVVALFMLASIIPIIPIPEAYEHYSWDYRETFGRIFDERYRLAFTTAFWSGAESTALFLFWPIAMYLIVQGSYVMLGLILSATLIATVLLQSLRPRIANLTKRSVPVTALLSSSGWILRATAATPIAVFFIDTYHFGVTPPRGDIQTRIAAPETDTYVDEVSVLKELGAGFGAIGMCCVGAFATNTNDMYSAAIIIFGVTAIAAGAFAAYIRRSDELIF